MQIRVGPVIYPVIVENNLMGSDGRMLHGEARHIRPEIALNAGNTPDVQQLTLWHEVLHCFEAVYGEIGFDEVTVNRLSAYIVMALRDNPTLRGESNEAPAAT